MLAKRSPPDNASHFERVEGSGGDGGVEALWVLKDGKKVGYQAKYFLSLGSSSWQQIDRSVKRAVEVHPELKKYIIAIPCNLTGKKKSEGTGSSGREKWDNYKSKWESWIGEKKLSVEIELWDKTHLLNMLLKEENSGMIDLWFGETILNTSWFKKHIKLSTKILDDRYNPDDHVETSIESMFDAIVHGPKTVATIEEHFCKIAMLDTYSIESVISEHTHSSQMLADARKAKEHIMSLRSNFSEKWNIDGVRNSLNTYINQIDEIQKIIDAEVNAIEENNQSNGIIRFARKEISDIHTTCNQFASFLSGKDFKSEALRLAIITGQAGTGKSHLLGHISDIRVNIGMPTILLIGQNFTDAEIWQQVGDSIGLPVGSADDKLKLINTSAERKNTIALILIDAVNEGVGPQYWRTRIAAFAEKIKSFQNIALVVSCREEYLSFAFPVSFLNGTPIYEMKGYQNQEEFNRASERYLRSRGIVIPNTPWSYPELSNPLFLKAVSESLTARGLKEIPKGHQGFTETMKLYIESIAYRIGSNISPKELTEKVIIAVKKLSETMASDKLDYVDLDKARSIVADCFVHLSPPNASNWLDELINVSMLRRDLLSSPPLANTVNEVIRFSFQRFQDYLIAESLIRQVDERRLIHAFDKNKPLNHLFFNGNKKLGINFRYAGVIGVLSIIYPERFGTEFVLTLPGKSYLLDKLLFKLGLANWRNSRILRGGFSWFNEEILHDAFVESCKWRKTESFSELTKALFEKLNDPWEHGNALLADVSMIIDHPWNAKKLLHNQLIQMSMAERDSAWTTWVNSAHDEQINQVWKIINWASKGFSNHTSHQHLELAALMLTWFLASSDQKIRDHSTKALTKTMLYSQHIFKYLVDNFKNCDDPYVIERLYGAAFGACCLDQSTERLRSYSNTTYNGIFSDDKPPISLQTRDYALGIIEISEAKKCLPKGINIQKCQPPYNSTAPEFDLERESVERIAKEKGGEIIFYSVADQDGDYGNHTVSSHVRPFLKNYLHENKPLSLDQKKESFYKKSIEPYPDRVTGFKEFQDLEPYGSHLTYLTEQQNEPAIEDSSKHLKKLLTEEELDEFNDLYINHSWPNNFKRVDEQQCKLWIVKRAIDLGWNKDLFPNDAPHGYFSRRGGDLERIGKKYQRIALDELLARLSDNFWFLDEWSETPIVHKYTHLNFERSVEPTILIDEDRFKPSDNDGDSWIFQPDIELPEIGKKELSKWPFEEDPSSQFKEMIARKDSKNQDWMILYEDNCKTRQYLENPKDHRLKMKNFRYIYCVFVNQNEIDDFTASIVLKKELSVDEFKPTEFTDGPYILESPWRETWLTDKYSNSFRYEDDMTKFAIPVAGYYWESHLDKTMPDGYRCYLPKKWFAKELDINFSSHSLGQWVDNKDNTIIRVQQPLFWQPLEGRTVVAIKKDTLNEYEVRHGIIPVWILISERTSRPSGMPESVCLRRMEAIAWKKDGKWEHDNWLEDTPA